MKNVLLATLLATLGTASVASADSYFSITEAQGDSAIIELGSVVSDADGSVDVYTLEGGELGTLIGSRSVHAGANTNVRVPVNSAPVGDVVAVLTANGEVLAETRIDIDRN
ncbi:hypothetical protein OG2516_07957 [Oceanicola granulosus HTCC2516]|uniref:Uncharacterized protein n=1 Tax=Oceanicola granulosus (strain ATCC BAA-861 / DSM 15982 / KCTC 12143 / HTCC2516) TaxID=314256 RepID=Q2CI63_OCEGH|nr:hypothetical protein [Oceanicola granulosus]EAR52395.1 hypothetical protein OG2516_07957 [Oceanicola granulosus HTCC2516]